MTESPTMNRAATPDSLVTTIPGSALPGRFYTDPEVYAAELKSVFAHSWQAVGHISDLPAAGSRIVARIGVDEVVVVRDEGGVLRAFRNVCRHRGTRLVQGAETAEAIRCPYHGWTYRLDGRFLGAPEARLIPCLDKDKIGLLAAQVGTLAGFIFVNLDVNAPSLAEQTEGLAERVAAYTSQPMEVIGKSRLYDSANAMGQNANWKISVDNYLEGYHVPSAHPGLMRLLDYQRYSAEIHNGYVWVDAPLRDEPSKNRTERLYQRLVSPIPGLPAEEERVWHYALIYPNTALEFYPDHIYAWTMIPDGVGRVVMPEAAYRPVGTSTRTRIAQRVNAAINKVVSHEDEMIVERQQVGLATPGYRCGPLSRREIAVSWFAEKVRTDLAPTGIIDPDATSTSTSEPTSTSAPTASTPSGDN